MKRHVPLCVALVIVAATAAVRGDEEGFVKRTFRIDLSARETMQTQDWSGKAEISLGKIVAVQKTSGTMDTVHGDLSWTIVFAQDALARGNVYGFVSFSDHRSTHNSWGCVWADEASRESLLDAMLARRTYGASDEIVLKLTAGDDHTMGSMFRADADAPPVLRVDIEAPDEIRRVDIIKNGMHIYTKEPGGRTFQTVFRDFDVSPGKAYYYIRVLQRDPEAPDGDPEIAWSSPVFVEYE